MLNLIWKKILSCLIMVTLIATWKGKSLETFSASKTLSREASWPLAPPRWRGLILISDPWFWILISDPWSRSLILDGRTSSDGGQVATDAPPARIQVNPKSTIQVDIVEARSFPISWRWCKTMPRWCKISAAIPLTHPIAHTGFLHQHQSLGATRHLVRQGIKGDNLERLDVAKI